MGPILVSASALCENRLIWATNFRWYTRYDCRRRRRHCIRLIKRVVVMCVHFARSAAVAMADMSEHNTHTYIKKYIYILGRTQRTGSLPSQSLISRQRPQFAGRKACEVRVLRLMHAAGLSSLSSICLSPNVLRRAASRAYVRRDVDWFGIGFKFWRFAGAMIQ